MITTEKYPKFFLFLGIFYLESKKATLANPLTIQPTLRVTCGTMEFMCEDSQICTPVHWRCDGFADCDDASDEKNCLDGTALVETTTTTTTTAISTEDPTLKECMDGYLKCSTGRCIPLDWKCDGERDCPLNEDEMGCEEKCKSREFSCQDGACVPLLWRCDGEPDCHDRSDELNCTGHKTPSSMSAASTPTTTPASLSTCGVDTFGCDGGRCIPDDWKCDEDEDCEDGTDEADC